jgi:hypothetical protein
MSLHNLVFCLPVPGNELSSPSPPPYHPPPHLLPLPPLRHPPVTVAPPSPVALLPFSPFPPAAVRDTVRHHCVVNYTTTTTTSSVRGSIVRESGELRNYGHAGTCRKSAEDRSARCKFRNFAAIRSREEGGREGWSAWEYTRAKISPRDAIARTLPPRTLLINAKRRRGRYNVSVITE